MNRVVRELGERDGEVFVKKGKILVGFLCLPLSQPMVINSSWIRTFVHEKKKKEKL